jgi:xanthine dehydrogenase small subunit
VTEADGITVDGRAVPIGRPGESLMEVLRRAGFVSVKDGCSPQGQCGCCTVLVDGSPRVSCVTPARRVAGRTVTTVEGLDQPWRDRLVNAFTSTGASQCGFCTPGILCRLAGLAARGGDLEDRSAVDRALAAHLCRCTGWQTIVEAAAVAAGGDPGGLTVHGRDEAAAARRARIEGGVAQQVGSDVALGRGGFADDLAPADALVALAAGDDWVVGETLAEARAAAGAVQGRRTTMPLAHPLTLPPGEWAATLRTTWAEPAYLEADASWCRPGGEPASPLANGGAFGGKVASDLGAAARRLADSHCRPVRVLLSREEIVRRGPKRPPVAGGVRADGTGVLRVVATPGVGDMVHAAAPGLHVEEVAVPGPLTSLALRGAGWVEASLLLAAVDGRTSFTGPGGGRASAAVAADGSIAVEVWAGDPLDEVVLRSYCIGAAHMALGWVTSEGLAVDDAGVVHDLTIRSFGVLPASATPSIHIHIDPTRGPPVNGSDAVFAAVAAAVWQAAGRPQDWPTGPVEALAGAR